MNLKSVMSRFLTFFTLFLALGFGVSESFALTLKPGAEFQPTVYSETITLTAVYVSKTYDVQLNKNDGTSDSDAVVATYGEAMPDVTVPTRAGYMFEGYFTAKIGGVQYYDTQGKSVKVWDIDSDEPIVLYAHWMANGVCVPGTYYNSATKTVETCPAGSYCAGGDWNASTNNCAIKSCPTAYPNSVAGAKKEGDCYVSVAAGMYWNGTSAADCGAGTFKTAHQVYHDQTSSCESCASGYKSEKKASECYLTTDAGMYVATARADQVQCKKGDFCPGGETVIYGKTGGNKSCTTLAGGKYSMSATGTKSADMCYTESCALATNATTMSGKDYYGASVADTCVATSCKTGYGVQNGLCEPNVYTITLSGNGASENKVVYQKYAVGWYSDAAATDKITELPVPTRKYYTFVGYFLGANSGDQKITDASGAFISDTDWRKAQLTSNSTLYAHWRANTYTVKYNANGASGTMSDVQHVCGEPKNLTTNAFTSVSDDSQFLGWSTKSGATVAEYTNGQSVVNLAENDGAVVTLYPVWKACTKCAPGAGASCALTAPKGVCTYSTACKANYENLQNSGKYNPSCSAVKYGLSYVLNGGEFISGYGAVAECSVASGEITLPTAEKLVREDYRFAGWYDNEALTGNPVYSLPAGTCVANKKFYAKWTIGIEMCERGQYYNGTTFEACPKGYYCPGEGKVLKGTPGCSVECPAGYRDGGTGYASQSQCQMRVPQGSYLAKAKDTQATVCSAGKYTAVAVMVGYGETSECESCEENSYCTSGNKYSCSGQTGGVFVNSAAGSDSINSCYTKTVAGKYIMDNAVKSCPAPYYCPGNETVYYGETGGTKACADLSTTVDWISGITTDGATSPDKCYVSVAAGMYWNGTSAVDCNAGTYNTAHQVDYGKTSSCESCASGYKSEKKASECYLTTDAGMYVATAGADQVRCKKGDFCVGGETVIYGKTGGNKSCSTTLGSGYSSDAGTETKDMCFKSCADASGVANMTGRDYYGSDVADTCQATSCQSGYTVVDGVCELCPVDHVCDSARDNGNPYACSELTDGVYTKSEAGSGSVNECYLTTSAGKYVAKAGAGQQECVAGYYCPGAQKVMFNTIGGRNSCPDDFASSDAGAKVEEDCYTTCSMYPNATQMSGRDYSGAAQDTCEAIECEKGYTLKNGFCGSCPADHVCDPMYDSGRPHSCSELTGGKYTKAAANSASIDACYLLTEAGKYVAVASQGEVPCKVGDYCPGSTKVMYTEKGGSVACSSLGAGYYSSDAGAKAETQCYQDCASVTNALQMSGRDYYGSDDMDTCAVSICVAGFTVVDGKCSQCPVNHVCDPVRDDGKPYTCSDLTGGIYSRSEVGTGSIDACYLLTEAGKYVAAKGAGQVECAEDGYCTGSVVVRRDAIGGRTECPSGFERSDVGASSARQCYASCANTEKATAMSGRDYYGSDSMDTCLATSCVAGFTVVNGKCSQCPENHVCDPVRDNGKPYTCSELTIGVYVNSDAGTGSVENCYLVTDAGMYVARAGAGQVLCAEDGYCLGGVSVKRNAVGGRTECPVGFAMSDAGATNVQQCFTTCTLAPNAEQMVGRDYYANGKDTCAVVMCAPGYTLSNGRCVLCPADHVCHPEMESGTPVACTDLTRGTHGFALAGSDSVADCYTACEPYDVEYGTAVQLSDTEFYPAQCRYKGVSVTGNPCKIVDGLCVETSCNHNYEMINGKCVACARENAISYKQNGGNCVVESCVSGFHPNGQSCEINVAECSAPNALSAKREWNATKQSFGECIVTECAEGYHLGANVCQSDEQVCELEHGVGVREWNHKAKKWGDCVATKCDPGYTSDPGQTNELWKQCGRCNNMYSAGGELAASSYVDGCEIASCMYDGELYTLENNECVLICDTYSDETGSRKWNASRKKCERTCSPGYMSW